MYMEVSQDEGYLFGVPMLRVVCSLSRSILGSPYLGASYVS